MARNVRAKATGDLESRVTMLEKRTAALEQLSKKFTRKKRAYTDEQRAAIRARLLAGREAARKRRDNEAKPTTEKRTATESKKGEKAKTVPTPEQS
jgi:cell division protein FtsN